MRIAVKCLNEEKYMKRFLSDFHDLDWVSEIVIVDGRSSDFTVNEAKQFKKVVVHQHEYLPAFHDAEIIQAQILFSYFQNGEIFFLLDVDEFMTEGLKSFLAEVDKKGELPENADLVHIPRKTYEVLRYPDSPFAILDETGHTIFDHSIGQFPDYQPRLFRRSYKMHWVQSPHRCLLGFERNYNLPPDENVCILHPDKDDFRDRQAIERRWLRPNAARKELGLTADLYEAGVKPEYADAADPSYWKDK
jgi:hypothetical protein